MFDPPVFISVRDRVTDLRALVKWLEDAGHQRLVLLDNDSTYGPCVDYLRDSPHTVRHLGRNLGARAVWLAGLVPLDEVWVYTDPDVVPIEDCPKDALAYMQEILDAYRAWTRVSLGLYLDDVPESVHSLAWERKLVTPGSYAGGLYIAELEDNVYGSLVDTTFTLCRPGMPYDMRSIRLGFPYQMRHMSWYHFDDPTEEEQYYLQRAKRGPQGSSWAQDFPVNV